MARISKNTIEAQWRIGNSEDAVELQFTYDLNSVKRDIAKQSVTAALKEKDVRKFKLTSDEPSFKVSIPLTKGHFGLEGVITADFAGRTVFFKGTITGDTVKCPPPPPSSTITLFNF